MSDQRSTEGELSQTSRDSELEKRAEDYALAVCGGSPGARDDRQLCKRSYLAAATAERDKIIERWIPVSERLPPVRERILTWKKRGGVNPDEMRQEIDWYHNEHGRTAALKNEGVTHWMELPPAPTEEGKG